MNSTKAANSAPTIKLDCFTPLASPALRQTYQRTRLREEAGDDIAEHKHGNKTKGEFHAFLFA